MQSEIKRKAGKYAVVAVLLAVILGTVCYNLGVTPKTPFGVIPKTPLPGSASFLKTFSSRAELESFLTSNSMNQSALVPYYGSLEGIQPFVPSITNNSNGFVLEATAAPGFLPLSPSFTETSSSANSEYSNTNVQVAGVDELDIVKNDGKYIYTVSGNTVFVVNASQQDAGVVSRIACDDFAPSGIFLSGDSLVILGSNYSMTALPYLQDQAYEPQTYAKLYNISDRTKPDLLRTFTITGGYFDSRVIGKYVYFVTTMQACLQNDTAVLPEINSNNSVEGVPATQVYYSNVSDSYFSYTTFVAMNMQNASEEPTHMSIMTGAASNMYVSLNNMYVTFLGKAGSTTIYRIHMQDNSLACVAEGDVPGTVLNQFSMDEYGDYFRIATTTTEWTETAQDFTLPMPRITWSGNTPTFNTGSVQSTPVILIRSVQSTSVYVLDMNLSIVGRLENVSVGENFHSARFVGDRCYLVTFQATDPLFVISLADPTSPTILGNLTIPGYSDYLQPYDENHIIGVGKETVQADNGYFAWYQGIKISVFDVSNVSNPVQVANVTIGDRGSNSPVLSDHKALLFDKEKDLLVIPVTVATIDQNQYPNGVTSSAYGTLSWQGVYVYNITLTDGFVLKGNITHAETAGLPPSSLYVDRALYIGDVLYTISQEKIMLNSLVDLTFLKQVNLD